MILLKCLKWRFDIFFVFFMFQNSLIICVHCLKLLTKKQNKRVKYGACLHKNVQKLLAWSKQVTRGLFFLTIICFFLLTTFENTVEKNTGQTISKFLTFIMGRRSFFYRDYTNILKHIRKFRRRVDDLSRRSKRIVTAC